MFDDSEFAKLWQERSNKWAASPIVDDRAWQFEMSNEESITRVWIATASGVRLIETGKKAGGSGKDVCGALVTYSCPDG